MKILISSDGIHAHFYQRVSWLRAFTGCGIQTHLWDTTKVSAFDAFDSVQPDIFLGQLYNLTPSVIKCIKERPGLQVGLRAGDKGDHKDPIDLSRFNVLFSSDEDLEKLIELKKQTGQPEFVHIHYHGDDIKNTHSYFNSIGIPAVSLMMCADVHAYSDFPSLKNDPPPTPALQCDIGFVGGYWPYKGQVIDRYLTPLCHPVGKYNIKIFGNQPWRHVNQYCGTISDENVKNVFRSAKISPNLSEPHALEYGIDVNERIFKVLCSGGFCISDSMRAYRKVFEQGVVFAEDPEDFRNKIDHYKDDSEARKLIASAGRSHVLKNHTNFHRAASILEHFGHKPEAEKIRSDWVAFLASEGIK